MVFRDIDKKALIDNAATVSSKITIVGTDIAFTEDDFISEWDYEDYRYVPENGFIGQFVERIFDGKLKDLPNDINIENKEINLQIGINNGITGETTYYDYGNFIVTKIGEQDTTGISTFESADYTKKFNAEYVDSLTYPCLALELANSACEQAAVELATKGYTYCYAVPKEGLVAGTYRFLIDNASYEFVISENLNFYDSIMYIVDENRMVLKRVNEDFSITRTNLDYNLVSSATSTELKVRKTGYYDFINNDFVIENNQFESTDTLREVIKSVAKLAYTWVRVGTDNKVYLDFKKKTSSSYGLTINGKSYQETTKGNQLVDFDSPSGLYNVTYDKTTKLYTSSALNGDWAGLNIWVGTTPITINTGVNEYYYSADIRIKSGTYTQGKVNLFRTGSTLSGVTTKVSTISNPTLTSAFQRYMFKVVYTNNNENSLTDNNHFIQLATGITNLVLEVKDVMISKTNAPYEKYTGGIPSPNPHFPSEIKNVEGVTNLIPITLETQTTNGITYTKNKDGSVTLNGTATSKAAFVMYLKDVYLEKGSYILSILDKDIKGLTIGTQIDSSYYAGGTKRQIDLTTNSTFKKWYIDVESGTTLNNIIVYPMFEKGIIKHNFVPYGRWLKAITNNANYFKGIVSYTWQLNGSATTEMIGDYIKVIMPETPLRYSGIYLTNWGDNKTRYNNDTSYLVGKECVYSFYAKADKNRTIYFQLSDSSESYYINLTTEWERYTLKISNFNQTQVPVFYCGDTLDTTSFYIKDIMLSEKEVDYEPYKENTALVDLTKKNLFDKDTLIAGYVSVNATTDVVTPSDGHVTTQKIYTNGVTKLTAFQKSVTSNHQIYLFQFDEDGNIINSASTSNKAKTFDVATNTSYVRMIVDNALSNVINEDIKLYEGVETDDYYSFKENDTFKDGKYIQARAKIILDGTQTIDSVGIAGEKTTRVHYRNVLGANVPIYSQNKNSLSTALKYKVNWNLDEEGFYFDDNSKDLIIRVNKSAIGTTKEEVNAYLSEHPIEIEYILATPIEHTLNYETLELFDDVNNISFNDDLITEDDYEFVEDKITIDDYYETEKQPELYGPVNKVLLGMSTIDGENAYKAKLVDEIESLTIEGKSYQETRSGKNLFRSACTLKESNGLTTTYNDVNSNEVTISGTITSTWSNISSALPDVLPPGTYTLSISDPQIFGMNIKGNYEDGTIFEYGIGAGNTSKTFTTTQNVNGRYVFIHSLTNGNVVDAKFKIQLEKGSTATDIEQHGASPSPEYPSEIKNVEGVTNYLPYPYRDTTKTINGVTFIDNGDGSITVNGTATANASFKLLGVDYKQVPLEHKYITCGINSSQLVMRVINHSDGKYNILVSTSNTNKVAEVDLETYKEGYYELTVYSGNTINNVTVRPMIIDNITETDFVPHGRWLQLKTTGKNKLYLENKSGIKNGIIYTWEGTKLTLNGTATANTNIYNFVSWSATNENINRFIKPGTYTLSIQGASNIGRFSIKLYHKGSLVQQIPHHTNVNTRTFINGGYYSNCYISINSGATFDNEVFYFQQEEGDLTEYEPYKENITLINLNKKNYLNIDDLLNAGSEVYNGSTFTNMLNLTLEPNQNYVLFSDVNGSSTGDKNNRCLYWCVNNETIAIFKNKKQSFKTDNTGIVKIGFINNRTYSNEIINKTAYIKLYKGTDFDDYYKFGSIENIKDVFKNGILTEKIGKTILDGTQSIVYSDEAIGRYDYYIPNAKLKGLCLSTHFSYKFAVEDGKIYLSGASENRVSINYSSKTTKEEMNSWLSENPVTIYYELATPIEHTLNYEILELHEGYNNITTNDDLEPNMSIDISDIDNNVTTYSGNTITAVLSDNEETSLQIWDNPLTYTEDLRKIALNGSESLFGVRYTPMTTQTVGHPWLEASDYVKLTNLSNQTLYTYPLDRKLSYKGYIKSDISSKAPTLVQQQYEFNGDTDTKLTKTQISVDKANQRITAVASDISDTNEKVSQLTITTGEIKTEVSQKATKTELSNTKTELNNNINTAKNDAINTANTATDNKLKNYSTTTETNSAITQKADSILSTVSTIYTTKTESTTNINAAKQAAIDSANASTDDKLKNYSTTTEMNTAIEQKADSITSTVSATYITKTDSATNIKNAVNNIEIGGTNLWTGTKDFSTDAWVNISNWPESDEVYKDFVVKQRTGAWLGLYQTLEGKAGDIYTFSGYVKKTDGYTRIYAANATSNILVGTTNDEWEYFYTTHTITSDGTFNVRLENTNDTATTYVCGLKLEKGNKATDWTPALTDPDVEVEELKQKVTTLEQTSSGFNITISELSQFKTDTNSTLEGINADIKDVNTELDKKQSAEDVSKAMETRLEEGVDKVITKTGYSFTQDGLVVSKTGSEMSTVIDEDGMTINRSGNEVLVADHDGVIAYNLHANTYLLVGTNSRFENYTNDNGEARTGCFWIG